MRGFVILVVGDEGNKIGGFFGGMDELMLKKLFSGCLIMWVFLEIFFNKILEFFILFFFGI